MNAGTIAPPIEAVFQVPELAVGLIDVFRAGLADGGVGEPFTDFVYDVDVRATLAF